MWPPPPVQVSSTSGAVLSGYLGMQLLIRKSEKVSCLQFRSVVFPALDKCCDVQTGFGPIHGQLGFDSMMPEHNSIGFCSPCDAKFVPLDFVLQGL